MGTHIFLVKLLKNDCTVKYIEVVMNVVNKMTRNIFFGCYLPPAIQTPIMTHLVLLKALMTHTPPNEIVLISIRPP